EVDEVVGDAGDGDDVGGDSGGQLVDADAHGRDEQDRRDRRVGGVVDPAEDPGGGEHLVAGECEGEPGGHHHVGQHAGEDGEEHHDLQDGGRDGAEGALAGVNGGIFGR